MTSLIKIAWESGVRVNVVFVPRAEWPPYDTWQRDGDGKMFWPLWLARGR
jgi:hypothetical protein